MCFVKKEGRYKRNNKNVMSMERSRDNRGRDMPRLYTFTIEYPA